MKMFSSKLEEEINRDEGDKGDKKEEKERIIFPGSLFSSPSPTSPLSLFNSLVLALAMLIMIGVGVVLAQAPTPSDNDVNAVARELYCPVCENIPLDVCPTTACAQWRELIRLKLAQGQSKEQIKQYFVTQYGDRVLAEPPRSGLNWLAYGIPPVIFLVGIYLVYRGLRGVHAFQSRRPMPAAAAPPSEPPADAYLAQVEEELRKRD